MCQMNHVTLKKFHDRVVFTYNDPETGYPYVWDTVNSDGIIKGLTRGEYLNRISDGPPIERYLLSIARYRSMAQFLNILYEYGESLDYEKAITEVGMWAIRKHRKRYK